MATPEEIAAEKAAKEKAEQEAAAKAEAEAKAKEESEKNFEAWLAKQSDEIKKQHEEHVSGLKSALDTERKANKEKEKQLKKLAEFEAAEEKRKQEQMTETEKLQSELATAKAEKEQAALELTTERIKNAVLYEASQPVFGNKQKFAHPELAYDLLKTLPEIGDDGKVTGAKEALGELAKTYPELLEAVSGNGGTPRGAPQKTKVEPDKPKFRLPAW